MVYSLLDKLEAAGQQKLVLFLDNLNQIEKEKLLDDIKDVDFVRASHIFQQSMAAPPAVHRKEEIVPVTGVATILNRNEVQKEAWQKNGFSAISEGKLAVVLLAGGQGTRLGSTEPKGCFDIGLPSKKSLFQLQAERILRIETLASLETRRAFIPLYIMTSPFTHEPTRQFLKKNDYFGLKSEQVKFFKQGYLPCFHEDGSVILASTCQLARAPDGNGGVYAALEDSGSLKDMKKKGVKFVECFSVDNALVRVADPMFLGYFQETVAPCAAKVVKKAYATEKVGVFVRRFKEGPSEVVEYTELDPSTASSLDPLTGDLRFQWSNVCMHLFTLDFLEFVRPALDNGGRFHVAKKIIPSVNGEVKGIKLEQFIFDSFLHATSVALFEVARDEEFSPVKNASGCSTDSPETAKKNLLSLHKKWLQTAGGLVESTLLDEFGGVEVSPLVSYAGEGLGEKCRGRVFRNLSVIN